MRRTRSTKSRSSPARQTGWNVLDVEEVKEIFFRHAVGGRINVHSAVFERLLRDLYTEPSKVEIRTLVHFVTRVRRRAERRCLWQSITTTGESDESINEPTWIHFSEFYLALSRWLDQKGQKKAVKLSGHCRLSRFSIPPQGTEEQEQAAKLLFHRELALAAAAAAEKRGGPKRPYRKPSVNKPAKDISHPAHEAQDQEDSCGLDSEDVSSDSDSDPSNTVGGSDPGDVYVDEGSAFPDTASSPAMFV